MDALVEQEILGVHRRGAAEPLRLLDDDIPRQPGERDLQDAVVVAGVAGHRAVRERLSRVVLVVEEARAPDPMRDLMTVGVDGRKLGVVRRQQRERLLGSLPVGHVAERLPEAKRLAALLALGERRLVGFEGEARPRAARGGRDEGRHLLDLRRRKLHAERGHAVAAVSHLPLDGRLVQLQLVEVRPDLPVRAGRLERVAAAAAGAGEDLRARRAGTAAEPPQPARSGRIAKRRAAGALSFMTRCLGTIALWP